MSCARSRCQRRRLFGPRSLPHPQPVDHNWERSRPSSHFDPLLSSPQHGVKILLFCFSILNFFPRSPKSLERHIPISIRVGLSRNKGFLHDPSEAHQKHAFLAPREEAKSEEGHNWPGPGHRQNRPEGRHPRSETPRARALELRPRGFWTRGAAGRARLRRKPRNPLKPIARDSTFFLGFVQTSGPEVVSVTGPDKEELARKGSASGGG